MQIKIRKRSKLGASFVLDITVAIIMLNVIASFFYAAIFMSANNNLKANQDFHKEHLLSECAEVIQSIRYGEWDRNPGEGGWVSYQSTYPTGMYNLEYLEAARSWRLNKIVDRHGSHIINPEYLEINNLISGNFEKIFVKEEAENGQLVEKGERDYALRGVYIDNSAPHQSSIKCYVKTNKFNGQEENKISTYDVLEFIMMNYI